MLGTYLDTETDIKKRKCKAIEAMRSFRDIFRSKRISGNIKLGVFQTYITSIFLYTSELWSLTKAKNHLQ